MTPEWPRIGGRSDRRWNMISTFHYGMPKRHDQNMSVKHLRRKLRGHPGQLHVHGLLAVSDNRMLWMHQASNPATVDELHEDLKPYEGLYIVKLNLTVTFDHAKRKAEVEANRKARRITPGFKCRRGRRVGGAA